MMGVCMGKENGLMSAGELDPEGRFISVEGTSVGDVVATPPRTPIVFILGGPGSGKITHCDRAVQERQGIAHINMTDLIQQHVVGNGLGDFSQISPSNLIEVLQMEMKMAVNSRGFLISGYPRSMRDVVEYHKKLSRVDGVILLNWHTRILEKQIEYGSQLGDTVLQLARMELKNYSKQVLSVAEYYDQLHKLKVVDGERQPTDVYDDFVKALDLILTQPDQPLPHPQKAKAMATATSTSTPIVKPVTKPSTLKKVIWVIGGPGSNKSLLSSTCVRLHGNWDWLSVGQELRNFTDEMENDGKVDKTMQVAKVRNQLAKGELVDNNVVISLIRNFIAKSNKNIVVIDGFPRNYQQVTDFDKNIVTSSNCVLVDCSEVELGRSLGQRAQSNLDRLDDQNSSAVKKRLEVYRTVTLPTLKILDDQHRLHIIDGDVEDKSRIVEEFNEKLVRISNSNKLQPPPTEKRKPSTDTINGMYNEVEQQ